MFKMLQDTSDMNSIIKQLTKEISLSKSFDGWSNYDKELNAWSYNHSEINVDIINLLMAYEISYQKSTFDGNTNLAKEICKCFLQVDTEKSIPIIPLYSFKEELKINCKKFKEQLMNYVITDLFAIELWWTYANNLFIPLPSLFLMLLFVEENSMTKFELDELFDSSDLKKHFFAIQVVNGLDNSKLKFFQKDYFETKIRKLLLTSTHSRIINSVLTYYRWNYAQANKEVRIFIASLLQSDNANIRWNALAYFSNHRNDYETFVDDKTRKILINDEDEDVRNNARTLTN